MNAARASSPLFALAVAALSIGCETAPSAPDQPLLIIEQLETHQSVTAAMTHDPSPGRRTYRITGGDDDGALVHRETSLTDRFNAQWLTVESIVTDAGPMPRRSEYWSINTEGDAVLHATVDHDEHAIMLFNPPMVTMPAELMPGEQREFQSQVRIVAEDNITQRRESGTATQRIRYEGAVRMHTPIGETAASTIVIEFEADLAMADAIERTVRFVAANAGIVAISRTRRVNVLGLPGSEHRQTLQLLSAK